MWEIVAECNDENDKPTVWARQIDHDIYGKYVWISIDGTRYNVEVSMNHNFKILKSCASLTSAKRWVSMNLACE